MARKRTSKRKSVRSRDAGQDVERSVASLRNAAYEAIKHRIVTCTFRPGEYINELQLSANLKIGRTPVHQALHRLMIEGMVEVIPRKGVIVKPVSLYDVLHIIEVRLINEPFAARLAAEQANDADLAELTAVVNRAEHWATLRNIENMMLLDREFHLLIAKAAKNDILAEVLRTLHERSLRFWFISLNAPAQYQSVLIEHECILAAVRQRKPDEAQLAMRVHIESFRKNVSQLL